MASRSIAYRHTAYPSAWLAGGSGFLYSVAFVIVARNNPALGNGLSGFFLLIGGLLGASALLGLNERLQPSSGTYATWALVLGLGGALAATLHGGYDLAVAIHPPNQTINFPSPVDPRGLGTFGLTGASLLAFSYLMQRDRSFPVTVGRSIVTYTTSLGLARESESRTFCAQTLRCSVTG